MQENNFDDLALFLKAIPKDMESGKVYQWECPVCKGIVKGTRDKSNNHLNAQCESCGLAVRQ